MITLDFFQWKRTLATARSSGKIYPPTHITLN
jgi:hypothetical protein